MKKTQTDKETLAHNLLSGSAYTRDSEVYKRAHRALSGLSHKALDALWSIECSRVFSRRVVQNNNS